MANKKRKRPFLPQGCGGAFAGLMLWAAIRKLAGESFTWWMGALLMFGCIAFGVLLGILDEHKAKIKEDVIYRKEKTKE